MEIKGHKKAWDKLKNLSDKSSLSLVFSGKEGVGKKLVALFFLKEIFGLDSIEKVENYPDIKIIYPENNMIKIEKIREAIQFSSLKSYQGGKKAIIIDDFHLTNLNGQNALLKLLEEPSSEEIIILITSDYGALLPTIRSRAINIPFGDLSTDDLMCIAKAKELMVSEEFICMAEGSAKAMIRLCEGDEGLMRKFALSYLLNMGDGFLNGRELPYMEFNLDAYYTSRILKDLIRVKTGEEPKFQISKDILAKKEFGIDFIIDKVKKLDRASTLYKGNYNKKLIITELFFT